MIEENTSFGQGKVSVLISTYNRARYLPRAIDSALNQTYGNAEIIIADDGSTDETAGVCAGYRNRIRYMRQDRSGLSQARQLALTNATGEYLAWLDDDDSWMPDKLERMVQYLEVHPHYGWAHSDAIEVDTKDNIIHDSYLKQFGRLKMEGYVYKEMLSVCFPLTSTVIMKRSCLEKLGGFDPDENYGADVDFYLRCSLHYPIGIVKEPLVKRLLHERGTERANNVYDEYSQISCRIPIFERVLDKNKNLSIEQKKETLAMLSSYRYRLGELYWGEYDLEACRRLFLQSMAWNKHSTRALLYVVLTFLPVSLIRFLRRARRSVRG